MHMSKFLVYTTIGSLIWNTVLIVIGSIVGNNWTSILSVLDTYSKIVVIVMAIVVILFIVIFYKKRLKHEKIN